MVRRNRLAPALAKLRLLLERFDQGGLAVDAVQTVDRQRIDMLDRRIDRDRLVRSLR